MAFPLAILASIVAGVAVVWAWRARAAALRLALEMIELRDRLAAVERAHLEAEEVTAVHRSRGTGVDPTLVPRLVALEDQVRKTEIAPPASAAPEPTEEDPQTQVRKQLQRRGFERVVFLGTAEDGRYLVETERAGVVSKGHAELAADGVVHLRSMSSLRAFP